MLKLDSIVKEYVSGEGPYLALKGITLNIDRGDFIIVYGPSGCGDSDIMMTDTINPLKSKFKGFHKTFKQDDLGLSLSSFLLN